jgi:hypothetical protein
VVFEPIFVLAVLAVAGFFGWTALCAFRERGQNEPSDWGFFVVGALAFAALATLAGLDWWYTVFG